MISNLNCLNVRQIKQKEIGPTEEINDKSLRLMLTNYTLDRIAVRLSRAKKSKPQAVKGQTNKEVERLITTLQKDEQKALQVFIEAGESEDKTQYKQAFQLNQHLIEAMRPRIRQVRDPRLDLSFVQHFIQISTCLVNLDNYPLAFLYLI